MKIITTQHKEYLLAFLILGSFVTYYFDLLKDGMVMSGLFAVVMMIYIGIIWQEKISDERDEFIRSKVDRMLYIITLILLLIDITIKTFAHVSYMNELIILTTLSLAKVIVSAVLRNKH